MPGAEVDAQRLEACPQLGVVAIEEVVEADAKRIRTPLQEQVEQVPTASPQRDIEWAPRFEVRIVAVAEQEQDECVVTAFERDFQRRDQTPALHRDAGFELQRPVVLDPALDLVEPTGAAELVQWCERIEIGSRAWGTSCGA